VVRRSHYHQSGDADAGENPTKQTLTIAANSNRTVLLSIG
jgi:hypothetical protein